MLNIGSRSSQKTGSEIDAIGFNWKRMDGTSSQSGNVN